MDVKFLGTAAEERVPDPWCRCATCRDARRRGGRNVRYCSAALINDDLLIDAGPDVPASAARLGCDLTLVQALLVTHPHGDHPSKETLGARHRDWGGTPLPLLTIYASHASLSLFSHWDANRLQPYRISPFERIDIRTGGRFSADPRQPRYPGVP